MKRILFVEDNAMLLQMYSMMLRREREDWEVTTAADAVHALALMRQSRFDVIASDMRMPGMSGLELLEEVRKNYPQTSRIIISGIDDQQEIAESLSSTHQFLPKPFDVKTLKAILGRLVGLDAYLKDERIKTVVGRMRSMPSFPTLYLQIMKEIESPNSDIKTIAEIVASDPSLTAKTLQVANSAALGLTQKVHDPFAAVQQLGMNTVRSLALSAHVFSSYEPPKSKGLDIGALWDHLMKTGQQARKIMLGEQADPAEAEAACTAGMLHDMGRLMLAENLAEDFQRALALAEERDAPLIETEMEVFGATHAGVAAYLLGLWGLPASVVEAVAFHHTPGLSDLKEFSPLTAVHVANALEPETCQHAATGKQSGLDLHYLAALGLEDRVDGWRRQAAGHIHEQAVA